MITSTHEEVAGKFNEEMDVSLVDSANQNPRI